MDSSIDDPVIRQGESTGKKKKKSQLGKNNFKKKLENEIVIGYNTSSLKVKKQNSYNPNFESLKKKRERSVKSNKSLKKKKSNNRLFNNIPPSFVKTLGTPNQRYLDNRTPKSHQQQHSTSVWVSKSKKKSTMKRTNSYQKDNLNNRRGIIKDRTGGYIGFSNLKYQGNKGKKITKIFDGIIESKAFHSFTPGNYASDGDQKSILMGFERKSRSKKRRDFSNGGGTPNSNPGSFQGYRSRDLSQKSKEMSNNYQAKLELNSKFLSKMKKKNMKSGGLGVQHKITMNVTLVI